MLPRAHRMRDGEAFRTTMRRGTKGIQPDLVVHLGHTSEPTDPTSVGFVVSKQVGGAVTRNQVKRRLRHEMSRRVTGFPTGRMVVTRALPGAADRTSDELGDQLDRALALAEARARR